MIKTNCYVCSKFITDEVPELEKFCTWPCPKTFPIISQSPTWEPIGLAIPVSFNSDQGTPRFQNWESSLYCRFIPASSRLFHEFAFKFQRDLKDTGYTLSIATFRSFLAMRRQVTFKYLQIKFQ